MDPKKAGLDKELRNAGIKIEPAEITEAPPRYPFEIGRRCINIIDDEKGRKPCGNPLSRYNVFNVCYACRAGMRGNVTYYMLKNTKRYAGKEGLRQVKHF